MSSTNQKLLTTTSSVQVPVRGLYRDLSSLRLAFSKALQHANLLAPVVRIDFIPELHSISLRVLVLNPTPPDENGAGGGGDVYLREPGRPYELALTKVALDKIAAAAGISWDARLSGRLDDGSHPHYARFRAVGWIVDFDGGRRQIGGEKEVDLREDSTTIHDWPAARLRAAREHILALAESKAKNRAIRQALAIKSAYSPQELRRPFVVPKLVFTGETDDPELKKTIALKMADRALGITQELYGPSYGGGPDLPALGAVPRDAALGTEPPPPIRPGKIPPEAPAQLVIAGETPDSARVTPMARRHERTETSEEPEFPF